MGAPWGVPWVPKFLPQSETSLAPLGMVLKSVTLSKQGRRNGFSKVAPWMGGRGLHGGPLGFPNFYQDPKTSLGTSRNSLKSFA